MGQVGTRNTGVLCQLPVFLGLTTSESLTIIIPIVAVIVMVVFVMGLTKEWCPEGQYFKMHSDLKVKDTI